MKNNKKGGNKHERDWVMTFIILIVSLLTCGLINLLMYLIDGITPKQFFSIKNNPFMIKGGKI